MGRAWIVVLVGMTVACGGDPQLEKRDRYCRKRQDDRFAFCSSKKECERASVQCFTPPSVWCHAWQGFDTRKDRAVVVHSCFATASDCAENFALPRADETLEPCRAYDSVKAPIDE